jgi:hypothetical protein
MPLEVWKSVFEIGGVMLLALTFIFGAGALIVNNRLNAIQSKELDERNKIIFQPILRVVSSRWQLPRRTSSVFAATGWFGAVVDLYTRDYGRD